MIGASGGMQVRISDRVVSKLQVSCQRWMRSFSSLGAKIPIWTLQLSPNYAFRVTWGTHGGFRFKFQFLITLVTTEYRLPGKVVFVLLN